MRISDWSSDVCSSDLDSHTGTQGAFGALAWGIGSSEAEHALATGTLRVRKPATMRVTVTGRLADGVGAKDLALHIIALVGSDGAQGHAVRSEEHTSELQSLMRISYAVFCLKNK